KVRSRSTLTAPPDDSASAPTKLVFSCATPVKNIGKVARASTTVARSRLGLLRDCSDAPIRPLKRPSPARKSFAPSAGRARRPTAAAVHPFAGGAHRAPRPVGAEARTLVRRGDGAARRDPAASPLYSISTEYRGRASAVPSARVVRGRARARAPRGD